MNSLDRYSKDHARECNRVERDVISCPFPSSLIVMSFCRRDLGNYAAAYSDLIRAQEINEQRAQIEARDGLNEDRIRIRQVILQVLNEIPTLTITLSPARKQPQDLKLWLDGATPLQLGKPIGVTPGPHEIAFAAPGYTFDPSEVRYIAKPGEGKAQELPFPGKDSSASTKSGEPGMAGPAKVSNADPGVRGQLQSPPSSRAIPLTVPPEERAEDVLPATSYPTDLPSPRGELQRTAGFVLGGIGTIALGAAGLFAFKERTLQGQCVDQGSPFDWSECNGARSDEVKAGVFAVTGVVALTGGVVLWLTAPKAGSSEFSSVRSGLSVGVVGPGVVGDYVW